jgi:hypothetical protein
MKSLARIAALMISFPVVAVADDETPESLLEKHSEASNKIADSQDELSADVQQLTLEQTVPKVIDLLSQVEKIMDEATDNLSAADTGGDTIAAQTEIIEKIYEAAKAKQKQQGSGKAGGAMMDMMERMMGKSPGGDKPGKGKGDKPGKSGGEGMNGLSDAENEAVGGETGGRVEVRTVPKAGGKAGRVLPEEFNKALDAYNRGLEKKIKG